MLDLFDRIAAERGVTVLTVTHDPVVASRSDRVIELRHGQVVTG